MIELKLGVEHRPDALRLDGFPLLCYSPDQWGEGVRTEDNGTPVADIAKAVQAGDDYDAIASAFGTSRAHVVQAMAWAMMNGED